MVRVPLKLKLPRTQKNGGKLSSLSTELRFLRRVRHQNLVLFFGVIVNVEAGSFPLVFQWVLLLHASHFCIQTRSGRQL